MLKRPVFCLTKQWREGAASFQGETAVNLFAFDHVHARGMAAAFKFGRQEGVDDVERQTFAHHAGADRQHVGVIVLADHAGRKRVGAHAAANAFDLVRRHHDTLAGAAQDDAQRAITRRHTLCRRLPVFGVMGAFRCGRANINHVPALGRNMFGDALPQFDSGVVAGEDDAVLICHVEKSHAPQRIGPWTLAGRGFGRALLSQTGQSSSTPLRLACVTGEEHTRAHQVPATSAWNRRQSSNLFAAHYSGCKRDRHQHLHPQYQFDLVARDLKPGLA